MAAGSGGGWFEADDLRRVVPLFSLAFLLVAAITQPSSAVDLILAAVPIAAFALWAFVPAVPLAAISLAIVVPTVLVQEAGDLEPVMFNVCLLSFAASRWLPSVGAAASLGALAAASPVLVALIQDPAEVAVGIWIVAVAFTWVCGRAVARQERLVLQLAGTRRQLAEQAFHAERRRIARDVHDFVGHGLAGMMLQVTSARHVLRRDADAAEEALRSAEEVGRHSMQELRRTVALLREDEVGVATPVPNAIEIPPSSIRHGTEASPSSCGREETCHGSHLASGSRSTALSRRRSPMPPAMRRTRGRCSGWSWRTAESRSSPTPLGLSSRDLFRGRSDPDTG